LFLFICSIWLGACNSNKETTKPIEIQELINFEEVKPNTLQILSDAKDIKIIEKTFINARALGEIDNKIVPQYKIKLNDKEYYLWIDHTITGTIANVNSRNMFYNIRATEEFKEAINYQEQKQFTSTRFDQGYLDNFIYENIFFLVVTICTKRAWLLLYVVKSMLF
jgi:hypothetical protein